MKDKFFHWIVLIGSSALIVGICFLLVMNLSFFITRKETMANVISVSKSSKYKIELTYYNDNLKKNIKATVKLKTSYRKEIERLGEIVPIHYSGLFPKNVYIQNYNVPKKGIIVFELIMLALMFFGFKSGLNGVRGK